MREHIVGKNDNRKIFAEYTQLHTSGFFQKLLKLNYYLLIKNLQSFINISFYVDPNCSF